MACARERPADAPPLQRCSRCLMAHYCDRECQKRDWATHKAACPNMALTGFKMMMDETAGKYDRLGEERARLVASNRNCLCPNEI